MPLLQPFYIFALMRKKVLWVILIVSLSLNAVFITWFAASLVVKHVFNREQPATVQEIAPASMPGFVGPMSKLQAKKAVSKYIKTCITDDGYKLDVQSWEIERACVSPYNELSTSRAASAIANARDQIRIQQAEIDDAQEALFGINSIVNRQRITSAQNIIRNCNDVIQENMRIIRNRDAQYDGQFLGWQVKIQFSIKGPSGNGNPFYERFVVKKNGNSVILQQTFDPQNPSNFDRVTQIIREVLKEEKAPSVSL